MSGGKSSAAEASSGRVLVSRRLLAAPRDRVFAAFLDPVQLAGWWGPEGFTNRFHCFDPRPGGAWRFTMRGPDGAEYPNECEFEEVVVPERIVFRHLQPMHHFRMEMTWAVRGEQTELTWRMEFVNAADLAPVREFILGANEQNFDRLAAQLARKS